MNKLKQLRDEFNYTLRDLETELDIPRSNLNLIELGKLFTKNVEKIYKLCDFFQVTFDYFWGKSNEGIYINYNNNSYILSESNFIKYKELGFIKYENNIRLLVLSDEYDIDFVHGNIKIIEVKPKKN
ncbi:MAG TPA: helix-turn-helix transcriptional regulator [Bacilli bacterium]|nr:helix-turn-helix transcriptional regulator [Bacilli bacterium]